MTQRAAWLAIPLLVATLVSFRSGTNEGLSVESIPLKEGQLLARALDFIDKNYVDSSSIDPLHMLEGASKELEQAIPPLLIKEQSKELKIRMGDQRLDLPLSNPISIKEISPILGKVLGFLDLFYHGELDEGERLTLAMNGLIASLDPHSNYLPPKVYNEFKIGTKGKFGGLGIVIGIRDGDLTVIAPLEGTPAYQVGLKAKDKIVQIGEESTINMGLSEAVDQLRGDVGTQVSLVVTRTGTAVPLKFTLTRALIQIQSVAGRILENKTGGPRLALLKIKNYQEDTMFQFKKIIRSFRAQGKLDGMILDLRNNPGGLLDQAISMADYFLSQGVIVKTVGAHGEVFEVEEAKPGEGGEEIPLVVLVDEGSASASEIVAGTLQGNDRAILLGNRTFGKGSVQTVYDLKDGSALKLTIAKYLTAKDRPVHSIGINPDVGLIPITLTEKMVDLFEDIKTREIDLEKEGPQKKEVSPLPLPQYQMRYLTLEGKDEENTGQIELDEDFPVRLAAKFLAESQPSDRPAFLKKVPKILETVAEEEDHRLQEAMTKIGVDWSKGSKEGKPRGVVTISLEDEKGRPRKGFSAGESGFLRVTVENRGNVPFDRLVGVTKSEDPLFANLEFPFGKVGPSEKREWKRALKIPDLVKRRNIPVELEFHEQFNRIPQTLKINLEVEEPPLPVFEYRYRIVDNGSRGTRGNGNGKMERGETVGLLFQIKNSGEGKSQAPVVNLKKVEGEEVFIEKGRQELEPLLPSGEEEALMRFRIPAKGKMEKVVFDLNIQDTHLGKELSDHLVIPLSQDPSSPPPGVFQTPPKILTDPKDPPLKSEGSYTLRGRVTDDHQVKYLVVFVGGEKVFYQQPATSGESKSLDFKIILPLKKGINLVTLEAEDDRALTTRKEWVLWRE